MTSLRAVGEGPDCLELLPIGALLDEWDTVEWDPRSDGRDRAADGDRTMTSPLIFVKCVFE